MPRTPAAHSAEQRWKVGADLRLVETLTSSVTTSWGVDWDETYIVCGALRR